MRVIDVLVGNRDPRSVAIKRLVGGGFVCAAAVIAACFGGAPNVSVGSQLVLQASSTSYDFGTVPVGMTATTSVPFVISSQGSNDDDTITDIYENCGDFDLDLNPSPVGYQVVACDLAMMGTAAFAGTGTGSGCIPTSYMFNATFTPVSGFPSSCTVHVDYAPTAGGSGQGSSITITLDGTGMAAANSLSLNPPTGSVFTFGDIPIGQTSTGQQVTVSNNGTSPLDVTAVSSGPYQVVGVGSATYPAQTLAAGESATYEVACASATLGPQPGTLSFTAPSTPTVNIALECNGVAATPLSVSPLPATFASTLVGRAPQNVTVTISNAGSGATLDVALAQTLGEVSIVGTNPNGQVLPNGGTATVTLHYAAATEHPMGQLATLTINGQAVAVNGEALVGTLGVTPGTTIDFGPVCVGATVSQPVSLYASDSGKVTISSVTAPAAPFTASSTSGQLDGSHANELMITAGVTPTAAGDLTGKIVVHTNLVVANPEIDLKATALPAGVSPTPDTVHFGQARVMTTTTTKEVIISNCGAAPITFTASRIEGPSAAEFALVSVLPASALAQRASTTLLIVMTAQSNGPKTAQLLLDTDGGPVVVNLDGNAFGAGETSSGDAATYYTCNAGGASGLGGSLAVLVLAVRRRRRRA